jgi:RiboL-PSP-HEPN
MFAALRSEIEARALDIKTFFDAARTMEKKRAVIMSKGLVFVSLYGLYEYTVKGIVKCAINELKRKGTLIKHIRLELLGLTLNPELTGIIDAGRNTAWTKRLIFFRRIDSSDVVDVADDVFPDDGSHFRQKQLETIWEILGIDLKTTPIVPNGRIYPILDELVDNRNKIAHGGATAVDIGKRSTVAEIVQKIAYIEQLCIHLCTTVESHCATQANLCR